MKLDRLLVLENDFVRFRSREDLARILENSPSFTNRVEVGALPNLFVVKLRLFYCFAMSEVRRESFRSKAS